MNPHVARFAGVGAKDRRVVVDSERTVGVLWRLPRRVGQRRAERVMDRFMMKGSLMAPMPMLMPKR